MNMQVLFCRQAIRLTFHNLLFDYNTVCDEIQQKLLLLRRTPKRVQFSYEQNKRKMPPRLGWHFFYGAL